MYKESDRTWIDKAKVNWDILFVDDQDLNNIYKSESTTVCILKWKTK